MQAAALQWGNLEVHPGGWGVNGFSLLCLSLRKVNNTVCVQGYELAPKGKALESAPHAARNAALQVAGG